MISHPIRCCFKIWGKNWKKLKTKQKKAREAGSTNTIPIPEFDPDNNSRMLLLPEKNTATIVSSHTSPSIGWLKPAKKILEWIIRIDNLLMPYSSYNIYTDGSYK